MPMKEQTPLEAIEALGIKNAATLEVLSAAVGVASEVARGNRPLDAQTIGSLLSSAIIGMHGVIMSLDRIHGAACSIGHMIGEELGGDEPPDAAANTGDDGVTASAFDTAGRTFDLNDFGRFLKATRDPADSGDADAIQDKVNVAIAEAFGLTGDDVEHIGDGVFKIDLDKAKPAERKVTDAKPRATGGTVGDIDGTWSPPPGLAESLRRAAFGPPRAKPVDVEAVKAEIKAAACAIIARTFGIDPADFTVDVGAKPSPKGGGL